MDGKVKPITPVEWVLLFLHAYTEKRKECVHESFLSTLVRPHAEFGQPCRLLDLVMMDVRCNEFPYRHLAASALYVMAPTDETKIVLLKAAGKVLFIFLTSAGVFLSCKHNFEKKFRNTFLFVNK
jgi:hypothetical protein